MQEKIEQLKTQLRYGDKQMIAHNLGISFPPVTKAFRKVSGFSDLDVKIYKEASRIINERKNIIKKL